MLGSQDDTGMTWIQVAENWGNVNVLLCSLLQVPAANPAVKTEEKKERMVENWDNCGSSVFDIILHCVEVAHKCNSELEHLV